MPSEEAAYSDFATTQQPSNSLKAQTHELTSYQGFSTQTEQPSTGQIKTQSTELSAYENFHCQSATADGRPAQKHPKADSQPSQPTEPTGNCFLQSYRTISGTMPAAARWAEQWPVVCFIDSCLRGLSQVLFLNNPITGLSVLLAAAICDRCAPSAQLASDAVACRYLLVYGIVGVVSSTGGALMLGVEGGPVRGGLMGETYALCLASVVF